MSEHNHLSTGNIESTNKVDLSIIGQGAIHEERRLVVISRVQADHNPLITSNREVTCTLLKRKSWSLQSFAEISLSSAVHFVIRIQHERTLRAADPKIDKVVNLFVRTEKPSSTGIINIAKMDCIVWGELLYLIYYFEGGALNRAIVPRPRSPIADN